MLTPEPQAFAEKACATLPTYQSLKRAFKEGDIRGARIMLRRESEITVRPRIALDMVENGPAAELERIAEVTMTAGLLLQELDALTA